MPTPSSGTRPGSQTNSYSGQLSVASGMSVVDDRKLDEILGDGLQNQVSLSENKVKSNFRNLKAHKINSFES